MFDWRRWCRAGYVHETRLPGHDSQALGGRVSWVQDDLLLESVSDSEFKHDRWRTTTSSGKILVVEPNNYNPTRRWWSSCRYAMEA